MVTIRHSYGLRTHPCGGAPHPGYVVFHTQIALLGWGTTSVVLSMPDDMPPMGWGITLVDGGQSRQRDKQYAPTFRRSEILKKILNFEQKIRDGDCHGHGHGNGHGNRDGQGNRHGHGQRQTNVQPFYWLLLPDLTLLRL